MPRHGHGGTSVIKEKRAAIQRVRATELSSDQLSEAFASFLSTTPSPRTGEGGTKRDDDAANGAASHLAIGSRRFRKGSPLHRLEVAIESADVDTVADVLEKMDTDVWFEHATAMLVLACCTGAGSDDDDRHDGDQHLDEARANIVAHLLEYGADPSDRARLPGQTRVSCEWTPLCCAARYGNLKVVRKLLDAEAEVDGAIEVGEASASAPFGQWRVLKPGDERAEVPGLPPHLARTTRIDVTRAKDSSAATVTYAAASPKSTLQLACRTTTSVVPIATYTTSSASGSVVIPHVPTSRAPSCEFVVRHVESGFEAKIPPLMSLPRQTHVGFTSSRSEMAVYWVSGYAGESPPEVEYGFAPEDLRLTSTGTSRTYTADMMCNAPANTSGVGAFLDPGFVHRVVLENLPPRTRIFYRHGSEAHGWSAVQSFVSRRAADDRTSVKFLMYADQALPVPEFGPAWRLTAPVVADVTENGFDAFLLHPGDLGYAEGSTFVWDVWGELVEPIAARIPYMVTVGNHEYDHDGFGGVDPSGAPPGGWHPQNEGEPFGNMGNDSHGECGVPTAARFDGTGNGNGVFWYSFDEGPVHVVVFSSEHDWRTGSIQHRWIDGDLEKVDRSVTPWVLVATHRMMYTTQMDEEADFRVSLGMRQHLEPLLVKHRVNMMLVGHQHSYERSCPVVNGTCVDNGTVHLTVGSAGATLEKHGVRPFKHAACPWNKRAFAAHDQDHTHKMNPSQFSPKYGNFSLVHRNRFGYIRLAASAQEMDVEFVEVPSAKERHEDVRITDRVTLKNPLWLD